MSGTFVFMQSEQQVFDQDIREVKTANSTGSNINIAIGTRRTTADGREYVYAKIGAAALPSGKAVWGPAVDAFATNAVVARTASIGEKTVFIINGAVSAAMDIFAEGWLLISDATGAGYVYKIRSNKAVAASSTAELTLYDELAVALVTTSETNVVPNQYNGVLIASSGNTAPILGGTVVSAAASGYMWIQRKGVGTALVEQTWEVSNELQAGSAAGSLAPSYTADTTFIPTVATVVRTAASGEFGLVNWCIT